MNVRIVAKLSGLLGVVLALAGCGSMNMQGSSGGAAFPPAPAPVPVSLDAKTSALLLLDFNAAVCQPTPACMASVPAVSALLGRARAAGVPVLYSTTGAPGKPNPVIAALAPRSGEPTVIARANKFIDTNLEELLRQRKAATLVIVGTAANGAVLYSAFHANVKGFTVVVAEDGISSREPIATQLTRYQLLNQPGFTNAGNKPLAGSMVTLSRSDLITFR